MQEEHWVDSSIAHLGSSVMVKDLGTGAVESYKLVLPGDADPTGGLVSVDSPLGSALLGRIEGERLRVTVKNRQRELEVVDVHRLPRFFRSLLGLVLEPLD